MVTWLRKREWTMGLDKLLDHHHRQVNRKAWGDLHQFSDALAASGQLKPVPDIVSPRLEITALCHRSLLNNGPALLFEKPGGSEIPVLGNLFGNQHRVLAALELQSSQDLRALGQELAFLRNPHLPDSRETALDAVSGFAKLAHITPKKKDKAPWQAQVIEGPDVDLEDLPISTCWPEDAGALITWGMVITRGPNKPRVNLAIYRLQLIGKNKLIMRWLPHRGGAQDFREFQQSHPGKPYPVSVVIGADPATLLAAAGDQLTVLRRGRYPIADLRRRIPELSEGPARGEPAP